MPSYVIVLFFIVGIVGFIVGFISAAPLGPHTNQVLLYDGQITPLEIKMQERQKDCDYCNSVGIIFLTLLDNIPESYPVYAFKIPNPTDEEMYPNEDSSSSEDSSSNEQDNRGDAEWLERQVSNRDQADYLNNSNVTFNYDETEKGQKERSKRQCCGQKNSKGCCGQANGKHQSCCGNRNKRSETLVASTTVAHTSTHQFTTPNTKSQHYEENEHKGISTGTKNQPCCGSRYVRSIKDMSNEDALSNSSLNLNQSEHTTEEEEEIETFKFHPYPLLSLHPFQNESSRLKREACCGQIQKEQTNCCGQVKDYIEWTCCGQEDRDINDCCGQLNLDVNGSHIMKKREAVNESIETESKKVFPLQENCTFIEDMTNKPGMFGSSEILVAVLCMNNFDNFGCNGSFGTAPVNCSALSTDKEQNDCCIQNFVYNFTDSFEVLFNLTFNAFIGVTPKRDPQAFIEVFPTIHPTNN